MFVTKGPIDPDSGLFIGRSGELAKMESWLQHGNCVGAILGARQTRKTSLLLKLRRIFAEKHAFAYVDLQAIDGADTVECFNFIAEEVCSQLSSQTGGATFRLPSTSREFMTFLQQIVAAVQCVRIVIVLDEIGALPPPTALKLSSAIRAAFTNRIIKPELAKCLFLLAGASDMLQVATGRNSPLRNVTESIYLGDFTLSETEELLNRASGSASLPSHPEMHRVLFSWTNGHPYWTQLLGLALGSREECVSDEAIARLVEELIRTEDKNLPHVFQLLQADDALWRVLEYLLDGAQLSFGRTNSTVATLELIGVLKNENGRCVIRNRIYREAMQKLQVRELRAPDNSLRILTRRIFASANANHALHEVVSHIHEAFQARFAVGFLKAANGVFVPEVHAGVSTETLAEVKFEPGSQLLEIPDAVFSPVEKLTSDSEKKTLQRLGCAIVAPLKARGDRLGFLALGSKLSGTPYHSPDLELLEAISDQAAAAIDRFRLQALEDDARLAYDIQKGLLPKTLPEITGLEIAGSWHPAQLVSGDYYGVFPYSGNRVAICIADVARHVMAALLMANLQAAVKALGSEVCSPKDLCTEVNRLICSNIAPGKFITFFYGLLNAETRLLTYTNAGHNPPILLRRNGEVVRLSEGGALLGIFPDWVWRHAPEFH